MSEDYAVHYQDVDFCWRFLDEGSGLLYVPHAELYHHESASRHEDYDLMDRALLMNAWRHRLSDGDPFYNKNFVLNSAESYKVRLVR
jgi:GT2 family glycosyltransferase